MACSPSVAVHIIKGLNLGNGVVGFSAWRWSWLLSTLARGGRFADADDLHVFLKDKCTVIFYSNDTCTKKIRAYEMGMEEWWCIAVQKMQLPFIF
jgi:hypothetical protein